jgi:hypothetical protein
MTPDIEYWRDQLADRWDSHPPEEWSIPLLRALIGLFDLAFQDEGIRDRPAPVLQLVPRPKKPSRKAPQPV